MLNCERQNSFYNLNNMAIGKRQTRSYLGQIVRNSTRLIIVIFIIIIITVSISLL